MLNKRIISAGIGIILLIVILILDRIFLNIAVAIISVMALFELLNALGYGKNKIVLITAFFSAIIISFNYFIPQSYTRLFIYIYSILMFLIFLIYHRAIGFKDVAILFFASSYIPFFLSHIVQTRNLPQGEVYIWFIFIGAWATDSFAFFGGKLFGKRKLCPEISPKKTVEGAISGTIGCGLSFLLYAYILNTWASYHIHYISIFILGMTCAILAQLGDLSASMIKRQYKIKDFGNIMPGHGGVLDRFDSILFVAPFIYYCLIFINRIQ